MHLLQIKNQRNNKMKAKAKQDKTIMRIFKSKEASK